MLPFFFGDDATQSDKRVQRVERERKTRLMVMTQDRPMDYTHIPYYIIFMSVNPLLWAEDSVGSIKQHKRGILHFVSLLVCPGGASL